MFIFTYISGSSLFKKMLGPVIVINFFFGGMLAVLPAFTLEIGGGDQHYGYFLSAITVGSLLGAVVTPKLNQIPLGKLYVYGFMLAGLSVMTISFVPFWVGLLLIMMRLWRKKLIQSDSGIGVLFKLIFVCASC